MTALITNDALAESQHVAALLKRHAATLPPGASQVNQLLLACQLFERCQQQSEAAVAAWRTALARRWECEIAGRRIYKYVERQYLEWYGPESLELQRIISHDGNFLPADLLARSAPDSGRSGVAGWPQRLGTQPWRGSCCRRAA